jgi:hypothetical protein
MLDHVLYEDYKAKLDYLTAQYTRLWQRFNFFLSVELGIFGFLSYLTFNAKALDATPLAAAIGIVVSALWYVVGAEDRYLVEVYRGRANEAARRVERAAGGIPDFERNHAGAEAPPPKGPWKPRSWYWAPISMTKLPATFGLLLLVVWLAILFAWRPAAYALSNR